MRDAVPWLAFLEPAFTCVGVARTPRRVFFWSFLYTTEVQSTWSPHSSVHNMPIEDFGWCTTSHQFVKRVKGVADSNTCICFGLPSFGLLKTFDITKHPYPDRKTCTDPFKWNNETNLEWLNYENNCSIREQLEMFAPLVARAHILHFFNSVWTLDYPLTMLQHNYDFPSKDPWALNGSTRSCRTLKST